MAVDRKTPTTTTDPLGVNGEDYADAINEEVESLWAHSTVFCSTVGGTANAVTASADVTLATLTTGVGVRFEAASTNTASVTLNVDSTGVKDLTDAGGSALPAGAIVSGVVYEAVYDGTQWRLTPEAIDFASLIPNYDEKETPVGGDSMVITDSEDSSAPKRISLSQLAAAVKSGLTLINSWDVSGLSTLDITDFNDELYYGYLIYFDAVVPDTDAVDLRALTSNDGGASYDSSASDYLNSSVAAAYIQLASPVGSDSGETGVYGNVEAH